MATRAVNIRVDEELYQYLQDRAEKEHRTLSNMIISILSDEHSKVGIWINADEEEWFGEQGECSYCGHVTIDVDKFCPHCGSKMKKSRKKIKTRS